MDKTEYKIRLDQIKSLIKDGSYIEAMEVCDTVDWKAVRSVETLRMVSKVYAVNRRYVDARDLLLLAYDRNPNNKKVIYTLCELAIKLNDIVEAKNCYNEYVEIAPESSEAKMLQYKIFEAMGVNISERIELLEKIAEEAGQDKWAYELASQYSVVGDVDKCVKACDKLIMWYGDGKYVRKALELKQTYRPLTDTQQEKYNQMLNEDELSEYIAEGYTGEVYAGDEYAEGYTGEVYAGDEYAEGYTGDVYAGDEYAEGYTGEVYAGDEYAEGYTGDVYAGDEYTSEAQPEDMQLRTEIEDTSEVTFTEKKKEPRPALKDDDFEPDEQGIIPTTDESAVEVAELRIDKYSTMNIQEELSKNVKEFFADAEGVQLDPVTGELPDIANEAENAGRAVVAAEAVVMAETAAAAKTKPEDGNVVSHKSSVSAPIKRKSKSENTEASAISETGLLNAAAAISETRNIRAELEKAGPQVKSFTPENQINRILSQDSDGQISLVVPEPAPEDPQITGQISIDSYLAEWDKKRRENTRRRIAEARIKSLQQTNDIASQLEGKMPHVTGPIPSVEEMAKDIKVQGEAGYIPTGELPPVPELHPTGELPTEQIAAQEAQYADSQQMVMQYGEEYYEQPSDYGYEEPVYDSSAYEGSVYDTSEIPVENEGSIYDTSEIPMDDYATSELPDPNAIEEQLPGYPDELPEEYGQPEDTGYGVGQTTEEIFSSEIGRQYAQEMGMSDSEEYPEEYNEQNDSEEYPEMYDNQGYEDEYIEEDYYTDNGINVTEEDLKEFFGSFMNLDDTRDMLLYAMSQVSMTPVIGNVFISGNEKSVRISTALGIAKLMQRYAPEFTGKIAKVPAEALNTKDVRKAMAAMNNGALIIENAGNLNITTVEQIAKVINHSNVHIVILLECDNGDIEKLEAMHGFVAKMFDVRVDIPVSTNGDLVEYAKSYAKQNECVIDDMAILALHVRIDELQTSDHYVTTKEVEKIMDQAIKSADKMSLEHLKYVLFNQRYSDDDLLIIREKDFVAKK